jgi:hypothetical protein
MRKKIWEVVAGRGTIRDDSWFVVAVDFAEASKLAQKTFRDRWDEGGDRELLSVSIRGELA